MTAKNRLTGARSLHLDKEVDLEAVLRGIVDEVTTLLDADRGTLYLVDSARGEVVSRVADLPEMPEIRLQLGEGAAGWVAARGEVINIPVGTTDPRFNPSIDKQTGYKTRSLLAVPIRSDAGAVIGVLQVLNKRTGVFEAADEASLVELAEHAASLLASTSLRPQLREDHKRALSFRFNNIVGESPAMVEVYDRVSRAAPTHATVLIRGESGTGKEAIARAVHFNSQRRARPFVKVDCAALPEQLIENELFGHEKGAYTGADRAADGKVQVADGGTLFLDEVGEMPQPVQGKLLRLLQDRSFRRVGGTDLHTVDVRFVCATHRDLEADVRAGRFRQDLYYRLRVVEIMLPPLRDRGPEDLDRLIDHFLYRAIERHDRPVRLAPLARTRLHAHTWAGNVRELEHCIESAVVLAAGAEIRPEELPLGDSLSGAQTVPPGAFVTEVGALRDVEREYIMHVLRQCGGNRTKAAELLGIGRNTLLRKLR